MATMKVIKTTRTVRSFARWSKDAFYDLQVWRNLTKKKRQQDPICEICKEHNVIKSADLSDHHRPRRLWPELSLVLENLTSMCKRCHGVKSLLERDCQTQESWEHTMKTDGRFWKE